MKFLIFLCISVIYSVNGNVINTGVSNTYNKGDVLGNYAFGYDIKDGLGASNFRNEQGDAYGTKVGSYGLQDIDGRSRIVEYVADKGGFRASIKTNEPGTSSADTAGATFNGPKAVEDGTIYHQPQAYVKANPGHDNLYNLFQY